MHLVEGVVLGRRCGVNALRWPARTVGKMDTTSHLVTAIAVDPAPHGYFKFADLRDRWRRGTTKTNELVDRDDFPDVRWLDSERLWPRHRVWAWEESTFVSAGRTREMVAGPPDIDLPRLPPARTRGRKRVA